MPLAFEAVRNYMRIVKELDSEAGTITTIAVSEPILAIVAMDILNDTEETWHESISSLTSKLFQTCLIDRGRKGELFSRLLAVLAADNVRLGSGFGLPWPKFAAIPTLTVKQFLISLYGTEHEALISFLPGALLNSVMNFTHFVSTDKLLPPDEIARMCHDLLRRTAALQLASNQANIDLLIPIYIGDPQQHSVEAKCHWIGIQPKNRDEATTIVNFLREDIDVLEPVTATPTAGARKSARVEYTTCKRTLKRYTGQSSPLRQGAAHFLYNMPPTDVLILLFDLGSGAPVRGKALELAQTAQADPATTIFVLRSRGHTSAMFDCLRNRNCETPCNTFFDVQAKEIDPSVCQNDWDNPASLCRYPEDARRRTTAADKASD
jgi:hypothetical protein